MNTILRFQVIVVSCIILMTSYFVMAEQQTITFEMGEGAHTITFPMTAKELKAHKKYQKQIKDIVERNKKNVTTEQNFETIEMGDGAYTFDYPRTEKNLEIYNIYQQKINAIIEQNKKNEKSMEGLEIVEIADGHTVTF